MGSVSVGVNTKFYMSLRIKLVFILFHLKKNPTIFLF